MIFHGDRRGCKTIKGSVDEVCALIADSNLSVWTGLGKSRLGSSLLRMAERCRSPSVKGIGSGASCILGWKRAAADDSIEPVGDERPRRRTCRDNGCAGHSGCWDGVSCHWSCCSLEYCKRTQRHRRECQSFFRMESAKHRLFASATRGSGDEYAQPEHGLTTVVCRRQSLLDQCPESASITDVCVHLSPTHHGHSGIVRLLSQ